MNYYIPKIFSLLLSSIESLNGYILKEFELIQKNSNS